MKVSRVYDALVECVSVAADSVLICSGHSGGAVRHLHLVCQQPLVQQVGSDLPDNAPWLAVPLCCPFVMWSCYV